MHRSIRPLLTLCALALLAPAAADAQAPAATTIDGTPLNVSATPDGRVQASVDGATGAEFFQPFGFDPTTGNPTPNVNNGSAGFNIVIDPGGPNQQGYGNLLSSGSSSYPAPTSGPTLTAGNPATIATTWNFVDRSSGAPQFRLDQLLTYNQGAREFEMDYTVTNTSAGPLRFRANVAADLAIRGTDSGIGFLLPGPPRFMGGLNQAVGAAGGMVEITPWTHYESNGLGLVRSGASDATGQGFDDSISTDELDNAAGVQWDNHFTPGTELATGASDTYRVAWRFIDTLGLTPTTDQKLTGEQAVLTATVGDLNGNPTPNQTIDFTVQGANNLSGKVNTGGDEKGKISYVGGAPGTDMITAFVDSNGNGSRDSNEAQAVATIEWTGPPAPVIGTSAGVRPVKGTVKIKLPPGTSLGKAKRLGLQGAATSFVKLTEAMQIPMGSTLDTTKGTVNLLSSGSKDPLSGKFQSGDFKDGQFKLTQGKKNPLTQLTMRGGNLKGCNTRVPRGGAARKRGRRLFGNSHGRFRTRGRSSSATTRGTQWTMTDTCAGTLTAVKSGTVIVRDFRLHKNKTVKAGKKYFARATKLRRVKK